MNKNERFRNILSQAADLCGPAPVTLTLTQIQALLEAPTEAQEAVVEEALRATSEYKELYEESQDYLATTRAMLLEAEAKIAEYEQFLSTLKEHCVLRVVTWGSNAGKEGYLDVQPEAAAVLRELAKKPEDFVPEVWTYNESSGSVYNTCCILDAEGEVPTEKEEEEAPF